jgi:hypothetical protein
MLFCMARHTLTLSKSAFGSAAGLYASISLLLFILTSNGWSIFGAILLAILFYAGVFFLIIGYICRTRSFPITFSLIDIVGMLTAQVIALLLHTGDCGDGPGNISYFQSLIHGYVFAPTCWQVGVYQASPLSQLFPVAVIVSLFFLFRLASVPRK